MARKMKLDFTGVESFERAPEGRHNCKIVSADVKQSQGGNDMIVVAFEVMKGEGKGARVYENYPLIETALWKLKGLLQAIGMKADGKVQLDLDKLIGKTCEVNVTHEEYEGKIRARVESVAKIKVTQDSDADDDEEDDSAEESEETEDDDTDEEEEPEEKPKKKAAPKKTEKKVEKKSKKQPEPEEDEDDEDWDEDEDSEEEEEKKPAKKVTKKPVKKAAKKAEKSEDDDWDDDDEDWDEE